MFDPTARNHSVSKKQVIVVATKVWRRLRMATDVADDNAQSS